MYVRTTSSIYQFLLWGMYGIVILSVVRVIVQVFNVKWCVPAVRPASTHSLSNLQAEYLVYQQTDPQAVASIEEQ